MILAIMKWPTVRMRNTHIMVRLFCCSRGSGVTPSTCSLGPKGPKNHYFWMKDEACALISGFCLVCRNLGASVRPSRRYRPFSGVTFDLPEPKDVVLVVGGGGYYMETQPSGMD